VSVFFEKFAAKRIATAGVQCGAIANTQVGRQAQNSAIDGLLKILDRFSRDLGKRLNYSKKKSLHRTVLTHDIEGASNNTHPIVQVMHQRQIPQYLTDLTTTFKSDRTLSFCFDGLRGTPKPFNADLPQGSPASPILFLIYANTIMNPTIAMNNHLELECTYIDDIGIVQAATKIDNAIFRLKTRSEIQIDRAKILHIRYSPDKSDLMFRFPTGSAFKSIEPDDYLLA
jgi:hypothetical protein